MQEQIIQEKDEPPVTGATAPATKKLGPNPGGAQGWMCYSHL